MRIWGERGDFSKLTVEGIKAGQEGEQNGEDGEEDARPTAQDMRELQAGMIEQLAYEPLCSLGCSRLTLRTYRLARQELATALDLLSVVAPLSDPPTVDLEALPLPPQTLTIVPSVPPPPPSSDPAQNPLALLPLATSLHSIKGSAEAFFRASEKLLPSPPASPPATPTTIKKRIATTSPSPWPTLLHLRSTTAYTLLPVGALPGASLSGKGETRAAREVGVFFGCEEAKEAYRRGSVVRVGDLLKDDGEATGTKGRILVLSLEMDGQEERVVWNEEQEGTRGVEKLLAVRSRAAFAEEMFAVASLFTTLSSAR